MTIPRMATESQVRTSQISPFLKVKCPPLMTTSLLANESSNSMLLL